MFLFGRHKNGHEGHYDFEGKQEKPAVGQIKEKEFGEELAKDGDIMTLTPTELIPIQEWRPPCCKPGMMLAAQTTPLWLCHIPLQVGSGTAATPFCGIIHVFLIHHLDFVKHHKAPKAGLKRPFSHRFALA